MPKNDQNEKINENNVVDYNLSLCWIRYYQI